MLDSLSKEIQQFLRPLQCKSRDDHIAAPLEGIGYRFVKFFHRWMEGLVQTVAVSGFHDDNVSAGRRCRAAQQGAAAVAEIA